MYAFSVPVALPLTTRHGYRRLRAALPQDAAGGLDPACVYLAIHDEDERARDALKARASAAGEAPVDLRLYREAELAAWPSWPMRLGRLTADAEGVSTLAEEPAALPGQLAALRARHPGKRRFRVALVGAFGFNLGDTLIGATAWRILLPVLRAALPGIGADLLFGPSAAPAVADLIGHEDGIDGVHFQGPSLTDFARYDAFFDFTGLVTLPRFHTMPALDWLLWWLGLDQDAVPAAAKRNRLRLPEDAVAWARGQLSARAAGTTIAFVWRASIPLRSMPDEEAVRFAADLLAAAPEITLVVDRPLALVHPRLLDLGAVTDSPERMMALIAQADGLIGVDSLAPHVADATDVPMVMLLATLPPSRFPYYPNMAIVTPPGADALPGWGRTKVADEVWPEIAADYAHAWAGISAARCWRLLADRIAARAPPGQRATVTEIRSDAGTATGDGGLPYDRPAPLDRWVGAEIAHLAGAFLAPGRTAVLVGGDAALALRLSRMVAREGALHVMEPRRLRTQALAAAAQAQGIASLHLHPAIAGTDVGRRRIAALDPASEADPAAWGNLLGRVEVAVTPLDDLDLPACDLVAIRPPHAWAEVLAGAPLLFMAARPLLMIGPIAASEHDGLRDALALIGYTAGLSAPAGRSATDGALVLAGPSEADVRMQGFTRLLD